jgi:hypothetical protein
MRLVILACGLLSALGAAFLAACIWLDCKLFEYVLWSFFKLDVPWYLDFVGASVLNVLNVVLAIGCFIARGFGAEVPIVTCTKSW